MSKLKRALSLVLCFAMLAGIFGVAANSIAPLVSAADDTAGDSRIDSYEDLNAKYDNFVYVGTEFWEYPREVGVTDEDGNPVLDENGEQVTKKTEFAHTDWYVDPGQVLQMRLFIKTDRYVGTGTVSISFDNTFFDLYKGGA
ncbi:MAG: hypothetical protein J6A60_05210, partial [Clostridia bacterium]|nr:hypothetical protein [Clostridia bacterium]